MSKASATERKRMKFKIEADKGAEVYVAGTFNEWNPRKNRLKFRDGLYAATILLPKGR